MRLKITVDIFSGRENPVIELSGEEAEEAIERLQPVKRVGKDSKPPPRIPTCGYRGLIIETISPRRRAKLPRRFKLANGEMFGRNLAHRPKDEAFEDSVLGEEGLIRKMNLDKHFLGAIKAEIDRYSVVRANWPVKVQPWYLREICKCGPLAETSWWNRAAIRPLNNCYNYGTNYRTDTYAQPGEAAGAKYTSLSCPSVRTAAIADDLIDTPSADNNCPAEGHLVALVIWPGSDYHWYRKCRNGYWSHKPGPSNATWLDNSGHLISDPRTADRGPYTDFCTFMLVRHGHI